MPNKIIISLICILFITTYTETLSNTTPQIEVVADGLLAPLGMDVLPDGTLLVAEEGTGQKDESAGVSLITPNGEVGRLISGFYSSLDAGDLGGVNIVQLAPDNQTLYIGHFGDGHLWSLPIEGETLSLPSTPLTLDDLTPVMLPLNNVRLVNPFDITFDAEGNPVVVDASGNGVAKSNPDGTAHFIHRFDRLPDPNPDSRASIDAVPTGITRIDDEYYVTLTGGCPYPDGGGRLVAIDEERNERVIVPHLNMPIDVAQGEDGTIWILEFARFTSSASCFTGQGYKPNTGRLSKLLPDGSLELVLDNLNFPGALLPMPDGSLYISEVMPGRIIRVRFGESESTEDGSTKPALPEEESQSTEPEKDCLLQPETCDLQSVIRNLNPNPGLEQREGDTPLAKLGQDLFFDPILSGDKNIACVTCHHPSLAMADGRVFPIGTGGHGLGQQRNFTDTITLSEEASSPRRFIGRGDVDETADQTTVPNPFVGWYVPRNSPSIINSALYPNQFWDGRVEKHGTSQIVRTQESTVNSLQLTDPLQTQALFPLISTIEMAGATLGDLTAPDIRRTLVDRLRTIPAYTEQFQQVFDLTADEINITHVSEAISAFQSRFIFTDAPWDAYLAGDTNALNESQQRGAYLFFGETNSAVNCAQCHQGDLFSDFQFHNLLVPQLGPSPGHDYSRREDWGRGRVTFDRRDLYKFRTPSLRNVELTAPYFHDGAFATLTDTVRHHADPWRSAEQYDPVAYQIPPAHYSSMRPFLSDKQGQTVAESLQHGLPLTDQNVADLVAFLQSLTDPAARDLSAFIPDSVPSGLPLDPLPSSTAQPLQQKKSPEPLNPDDRNDGDGNKENEETSQSSTPATLPTFKNVAAEIGLDFQHEAFQTAIFQDPAAMMGGGLCWLDYDNDGWLDLYLVNSHAEDEVDYWQGNLPTNALYHNQQGQFVEVSETSNTNLSMRGNGCVAADFNLDGWTDIHITADGPNALLWNNGDGTFSEGAEQANIAASEWNSAAVVGDVNQDGWPDLFVAAFIDLDYQIPKPTGAFPQDYYGLPDHLYLSQGLDETGRVTFQDVAEQVGLSRQERGLGALFSDVDKDGDVDLYIANDGHPNRLYKNRPLPADPYGLGFRLLDLTETAQVGDAGSGMGVAGGDYDGDGWFDLLVTNWERELNALYRNEFADAEQITFQYSTFRIGISGLGQGMTGWGVHWLDFDHDTDLDMFIINGRVPLTNLATDPELVRLYRNRMAENLDSQSRAMPIRRLFVEATDPAGLKEVGPLLGRGSAAADYDNDGDMDIALITIAGPMALLENQGAAGNWLMVQLTRFAPGTKLELTLPDGRVLVRELHVGSSYLASEDPRFHVGLGEVDLIPTLTVIYPDGTQFEAQDVTVNQHYLVGE
ncbi:ScyD/ScyE family protein [Anaerolineales bacterium HSG6]|nr:ScyD/ScyE family protein [Anaerolineales bacterium HSG6]